MDKTYLSANTLFHFTNNIDNIINILTNEFSPRYCMESFEFLGGFVIYHFLKLKIILKIMVDML